MCQSLALPSGQDASQNLKISHLFNFAFILFLFPFSSGSFVNPPVPGTECGSEVVPFTASAYFPAAEEPPPPPPGMCIRDLLVFECIGLSFRQINNNRNGELRKGNDDNSQDMRPENVIILP